MANFKTLQNLNLKDSHRGREDRRASEWRAERYHQQLQIQRLLLLLP
jgi:hypothetical protein